MMEFFTLPEDWSADYDGWIVVVAILAAVTCAVPGCFLLVRRQSMLGDAVSHAVLPGIGLGYLISGTRESSWMFFGAAIAGIATAALAQLLHTVGRVDRNASLGVVFTTFFALGLLLITQTADSVHLDPSCVLYGQIEYTPLDMVMVFGVDVPRAALVLGVVCGINILVVAVLWKELVIASFDPSLARSQGVSPLIIQQVLMVLVAATCVAAFESVGSILVVALLAAPAAVARLVCDRFGWMLPIAVGVAVVTAVLGQVLAMSVPRLIFEDVQDASISGSIAVVAGGMVVAAAVFAPKRGVVARFINVARLRLRTMEEDILGTLYRREAEGRTAESFREHLVAVGAMGSANHTQRGASWMVSIALRRLWKRGLLASRVEPTLTAAGRREAVNLVRTHRLWEKYFQRDAALPPSRWHDRAMDFEHLSDPEVLEQLESIAGDSATDPHGRAIPPSAKDD